LFEAYGEVMEADVISEKNYGFVHVDGGMGEIIADCMETKFELFV